MVQNEDFIGKGKHQIWEELLDRNYDLGKKLEAKCRMHCKVRWKLTVRDVKLYLMKLQYLKCY